MNKLIKAKLGDGGVYMYTESAGFWAIRKESMSKFISEMGIAENFELDTSAGDQPLGLLLDFVEVAQQHGHNVL